MRPWKRPNQLLITDGSCRVDLFQHSEKQSDLAFIADQERIPFGNWSPKNHAEFPLRTRQGIKTWLLIAARCALPKDIRLLICEWIATKSRWYWYFKELIKKNWM